MAHFIDPSNGKPIEQLFVPVSESVEIGVWGPLYPPPTWDKEVTVEPEHPGIVSVAQTRQGAGVKPITANVRSWSVTGKLGGKTVLNVKTLEGALFAAPLAVEVTALAWGRKVSAAFKQKVFEICKRLQMNPSHLMAIMHAESGLSPSASNRNAQGVVEAVGLIQFTEMAVPLVGKSLAALAVMSAVEQLDYVEKYFARFRGRLKTVEDVYLVNAAPALIGKPHTFVIWSDKDPNTRAVYQRNKALDADGDKDITVGDIGRRGRQSLEEGLKSGNIG